VDSAAATSRYGTGGQVIDGTFAKTSHKAIVMARLKA
jgi:hypothetical protein